MDDAEDAAWASIQGFPLLLAPWKAREAPHVARRDAKIAVRNAELAAQHALKVKRLLPDTAGVTSSALGRFHASIGFHGAFSSSRGQKSVFEVNEDAVLLSLPRSSLVSASPPDVLGGERVLVLVGESYRTLGHRDIVTSCECCKGYHETLYQLSVAILPPGASKFAPLLSLSYTAQYCPLEDAIDELTKSWGLTVDEGSSGALEE